MGGDYCGSGNKTVTLAAGDYRLELSTDITRNSWGTYRFAAFFVPDPQTYVLPLDGSDVSDGVPGRPQVERAFSAVEATPFPRWLGATQ